MRAFSISVNMGILKEIYVHFSSLHIFTDQRDLISFFNTKLYYVFWLIDLKGKGFINKCCSSNTASSLKIMIRPYISSKKNLKRPLIFFIKHSFIFCSFIILPTQCDEKVAPKNIYIWKFNLCHLYLDKGL